MINPSYVLMLNRFNVVCKVLAVAIVIVGAIIAAAMGATPANAFMGQSCFGPQTEWASFGKGMVFALFAFSGWNYLNPLTAEMKDPQRDVPRVLLCRMCAIPPANAYSSDVRSFPLGRCTRSVC